MAIRFCERCGHQVSSDALFCSYCGAKLPRSKDRVEEAALWEGTAPSSSSIDGSVNVATSPIPIVKHSDLYAAQEREILCYNCNNSIPSDSRFCPVCQIELFRSCPKCGNIFSTKYCNCNHCGTNIEQFLKQQKLASIVLGVLFKKKEEERILVEEKKRKAEQERVEREREERERLNPKITDFRIEKDVKTYFEGITVFWQTVNAPDYKLAVSNPKKDSGCWYIINKSTFYIGGFYEYKKGNETIGHVRISASDLLDYVPFFKGPDNSLYFKITAYGNDTFCTRTIRLRLLAYMLQPLQLVSIDEVENYY